jgi:hypothetical protein
MTAVLLDLPAHYWHCPACRFRDVTHRSDVHTQFHECKALTFAYIPMIEVSGPDVESTGRQVIVLREDDGSWASIRTERADGSNDVTVFAPTATTTAEGLY